MGASKSKASGVGGGPAPVNENKETSSMNRGRHTSGGSGYGSVRFQDGQPAPEKYIRRLSSTASTDRPFQRQASRLSQVSSGKSLSSYRTRLSSVPACDYHADLKPELAEGLNVNLLLAAFIIVFGSSFQFGYNIGVLNQPAKLIKQFFKDSYSARHNETISETQVTVLWSLTNALFIPGGMAGAFLGGWLADKIGRKRSILVSHLFAFAGASVSSACVAAQAPELLMLGRVLVGVNSGLGNCIAPMFLSEIAPYNLRGAFGTAHQLFVTIGIFLSSVFGISQLLGTETLWPFLILLEVVPALISLLVLPFLPETPRYLLLVRKERDQARKALEYYRRTDDVQTHMEEIDTETQKTAQSSADERPFQVRELFARELLMPLLIAASLQVIQQFSGINAIFFYSNTIFESAGVPTDQIPYAVIGTNAVNVAMTVISVPLMDIAGRRLLLLIPMVGMIIDLALITMSLNLQNEIVWMSYISVASVILYVICFAVGLGPIPMMIASELFRQGPRPYAMAAAGVVNWVFTFIIAMAFEPIQLKLQNYTFLLFLGLMIVFVIFVFFLVPETKGKTFEEIASRYAASGVIEVEEVIEEEDDVFGSGDGFPVPEANDDGEGEDHQLVTLNLECKDTPEDEKKDLLTSPD